MTIISRTEKDITYVCDDFDKIVAVWENPDGTITIRVDPIYSNHKIEIESVWHRPKSAINIIVSTKISQEEKGFTITCPGCNVSSTWTMFGSDWKCSTCEEWHYWWGAGWVKEGEHPSFKKIKF